MAANPENILTEKDVLSFEAYSNRKGGNAGICNMFIVCTFAGGVPKATWVVRKSRDEGMHAEEKALNDYLNDQHGIQSIEVYITHAPCETCANLIIDWHKSHGRPKMRILFGNDWSETALRALAAAGITAHFTTPDDILIPRQNYLQQ
jgi:hypothetical protein